MEPYERQPGLNRNQNYRYGYIHSNRVRRNTFRSLYESFLASTYDEYRGAVVKGTRFTSGDFLFCIAGSVVARITVNVENNTYSVKVFFPVTQYNKFRLFLRNLGIKAWGRKERTYIQVGDNKVDCKNLTELLIPDIPFTTVNLRIPNGVYSNRVVYTGTRNLTSQQGIFSQALGGTYHLGGTYGVGSATANLSPAFRDTFARPFNVSTPREIQQSDATYIFDAIRDRILTAERTSNPLRTSGTSLHAEVDAVTRNRDDFLQSIIELNNTFIRNNFDV